jgi:hypothetical protein
LNLMLLLYFEGYPHPRTLCLKFFITLGLGLDFEGYLLSENRKAASGSCRAAALLLL